LRILTADEFHIETFLLIFCFSYSFDTGQYFVQLGVAQCSFQSAFSAKQGFARGGISKAHRQAPQKSVEFLSIFRGDRESPLFST
jgi:hypothetical protein